MTQSIIASKLIERSMLLINVISAGETPSDTDLNDALLTLNEMLDSWALSPLSMYASSNSNFTAIPGTAVYPWQGPRFNTERPVWVNNATCIRSGVSTPIEIVSQVEYDRIPLKATPSPIIEKLLYVAEFPSGVVTLFPVPTEAVTINVNTTRQITGPVDLQTLIELPPGYLRALRYNLAVELWPEYKNATTDINSIKDIAKKSLGLVKSANSDVAVATFDDIPGVEVGRGWDWRVG